MEYTCLNWEGGARIHLSLLDKIQDRAKRIISQTWPGSPGVETNSLQHWRDVAGLKVLHEAQQNNLRSLKQQWRIGHYPTGADLNMFALMIPRARTTQSKGILHINTVIYGLIYVMKMYYHFIFIYIYLNRMWILYLNKSIDEFPINVVLK